MIDYVRPLRTCTTDDPSFKEALIKGTDDDLSAALKALQARPEGNKTRITRIEAALKKRQKEANNG